MVLLGGGDGKGEGGEDLWVISFLLLDGRPHNVFFKMGFGIYFFCLFNLVWPRRKTKPSINLGALLKSSDCNRDSYNSFLSPSADPL